VKKLQIKTLLSVAAISMTPAISRAEPPDFLTFHVGAGVEHDSNVRRTSAFTRSDDIGIASVGVSAEKTYGLQHFTADVVASAYRYRDATDLNYSTIDYTAVWDWKLTPAFHGIASALRRQFRDISDTATGGSSIGKRTERNELVEGIYNVDGVWRVLAGASHYSADTTVPVSWDASPSVSSARVGVGYEWASGSSLFGRLRRGDGEYRALAGGTGSADFKETEAEAQLKWILTGKTSLDARVGHLKRTHDGAPARDFSGLVANTALTWNYSVKTSVVAGVQRYLSASGLNSGGHVENTRLFVGPTWKATPHITANARYDRTTRNWKNIAVGAPEQGRHDVIEAASIGVDWEPRRVVTVSAQVRDERVKSNAPGGSYHNNAVALGVKVNF
jgi:exopolysaccharide biosynthesis operon protein EpsL